MQAAPFFSRRFIMNDIVKLFNDVRQIPGAAAKVKFLKARHTPFVDKIIADAMDPSVTYGVTSKDIVLSDSFDSRTYYGEAWYDWFHSLLGKLADRTLTGGNAQRDVAYELEGHSKETQELLKQVLDRDLKLGVSWKTYRKDVMGITEKFEVALAQHLEKVKGVDPVDGTWFASRKCDGVRNVAILVDGEVTFKSRQNKEFKTLENLKPAVKAFLAGLEGNWVLDGELCKVNDNGDEDFKAIVSEVKRKDYQIEECCYQVFDILPYDEFRAGKSKEPLHKRLELLGELLDAYLKQPHGKCWIKPLHQERLLSQDDFDRWAGYVEAGDWEGFMLRKDVPYQSGRTKDLLKVKKFLDREFVVDSAETGTMTTSLPGEGLKTFEGVTALHITYEGCDVRVGAGLSREQRIAWLSDPSLIIGKTITVKYFETSTNKDGGVSLRFPTLKYVYEGERDI